MEEFDPRGRAECGRCRDASTRIPGNTHETTDADVDATLQPVWLVDRGFSLVEVLIASTMLTVVSIGLAQLSMVSTGRNLTARFTTLESLLAAQKAAQLEALSWSYDASGDCISDRTTDTTLTPERATGGTGLAWSPGDALVRSVPGYVDYLDAQGRTLGGGAQPPPAALFVRRWSISPAASAADVVVIQVSVTTVASPTSGSRLRRHVDEARVVALKARTSG